MPKKLTVLLDDKLDERFRKVVFRRKGMHKGNITEAVEEAMLLWMNTGNADKDVEDKQE